MGAEVAEAILEAVEETEVQVKVRVLLQHAQVMWNSECPRMKCCHSNDHPRVVANRYCPQIVDAAVAWEGRPPLKLNLQAMRNKQMCQSQMDGDHDM